MKSKKLYLNIINQLQDGIYYVDINRKILFWSKAAETITGYTQEEMIGRSCPQCGLQHIDSEGRSLCALGCPLADTMEDHKERKEQVFIRHKDGYRVPVTIQVFPVVEDGEMQGAFEVISAQTVQPDFFEEAMQDELTKLPNRRNIMNFLELKMKEYVHFQKKFAVLFADIDDFSQVNNKYGHEVGDIVLRMVSKTLKNNTRLQDLIGRWGGEEFLGVYDVNSIEECQIMAERFRKLVENTEAHSVHVTISIGMTIVQQGDTVDSIVERADRYMYESKRSGKNRSYCSL